MVRILLSLACVAFASVGFAADPWLMFPGGDGPGKGKHVVLVSGDEEYRSEEALPMLAQILSKHHGFKTTVLFAIDPKDGMVQPNVNNNIPGLEALGSADLLVLFIRFRNLPDEQMKHFDDYFKSGKPILGLRTATHAFNLTSPTYKKYTWTSKDADFVGGFGKQILGETWVAHHGAHGKEGTRGVIAAGAESQPIFKGIEPGSIFGTTDVYTVKTPLPEGSTSLLIGEVTETLKPDSKAVVGKKNDPMMPLAWMKPYQIPDGKKGMAFTTTMGNGQDFDFEGTRRLIVNAVYVLAGMSEAIPAKSNVEFVVPYKATPFRAKKNEDWKPGKPPADYAK